MAGACVQNQVCGEERFLDGYGLLGTAKESLVSILPIKSLNVMKALAICYVYIFGYIKDKFLDKLGETHEDHVSNC